MAGCPGTVHCQMFALGYPRTCSGQDILREYKKQRAIVGNYRQFAANVCERLHAMLLFKPKDPLVLGLKSFLQPEVSDG